MVGEGDGRTPGGQDKEREEVLVQVYKEERGRGGVVGPSKIVRQESQENRKT